MVLRLLPLALLLGATSIAAQVPARRPTLAPTTRDSAATRVEAGWFGFRQLLRGDTLTVLEVASGSPADRAGLRTGDRILTIDGRTVNERHLNEWPSAVGALRKVTVLRGSDTLSFSIIAESPPRGVLMPARVALTNPDTVAREALRLRSEMVLRATKVDSTRRALRTREPLVTVDGVPVLRENLVYNELRAVTGVLDSARTGGAIENRALYGRLERTMREQNATIARLARAPNAISGAEFEELNPGLAEYFYGVSEGVFVLRVAEKTPAGSGGLRPGDIVQSVNGQDIRTIGDLRAAIAASEQSINLRILRKGAPASLVIEQFGRATRRPPED